MHTEIQLIPRPSRDYNDPLNWTWNKKVAMLFALTWTAFIMTGSPTTHQLGFVVEAVTFNKSPVALSYTASAAIAGLLGGPFFYPPLFTLFGRPAVLFWGCIAQLCTQIWAARMTHADDYIALVMSRLFSGCLGLLPLAIGNSFILEAFFLHQRGRLYALFELCHLFGVFAIPTISAFILQAQAPGWTDTFWWTVGPLGLSAALVFLFVYDTSYDRTNEVAFGPPESATWLQNRAQTFLTGWRHVAPWTAATVWQRTIAPVIIAVSPVSIIPGLYNLISYGFSVLAQLLLSIFLQTPEIAGGYGFTPQRNAYFSFVTWVALLAAELAGIALNDAIPLAVTRRSNGRWAPEARLWPIAIPAVLAPIGLGLYGATIQYHLHYMSLAFAQFLIQFAAQLSVPITTSYVIECFTGHPVEVSVATYAWRLALAVALPFTTDSWLAATGPGWLFGIAAFLNLFAAVLILGVAWKGAAIRRLSKSCRFYSSEEGEKVVASASETTVGGSRSGESAEDMDVDVRVGGKA